MSIRSKLFEASRFARDAHSFLQQAANRAVDGNDYVLGRRVTPLCVDASALLNNIMLLINDYEDTHPTEKGEV